MGEAKGMIRAIAAFMVFWSYLLTAIPGWCEDSNGDAGVGRSFTLWPLIDYRESPQEGFSNLGILGPLFKMQTQRDEQLLAFRPLFYRTSRETQQSAFTDYLYPLASKDSTPEASRLQVLQLFQINSFRKDEPEVKEQDSMFFPFFIKGMSKKYGAYTSIFPLYGNIYERFWRDEYHFFLFPLYGSTVKKGTTSRNYLYPFINTIEGERESGFHFWPLYGQSTKEGVYRKRFVLWPFFLTSQTGLDTENPTEKLLLFPLYASTDSRDITARSYLWPFFGYSEDRSRKETERDYVWPFCWTVRGEERRVDSFLPFYYNEERKESSRNWYLWPLYRRDSLTSDAFERERERLFYFLYIDSRERWPKDGTERRRTTLWPLFVYNRDTRGVKTISFPAPLEPILDRDGIEHIWAPLWRIYQQRWTDNGDSMASFLWNLYWHETRGNSLAYELYPLIGYRGETGGADMSILKGLVRYRSDGNRKKLHLLWLPFGFGWGDQATGKNGIHTPAAAGGGS